MPVQLFNAHDLYALARAFLDLPWQPDGLSPFGQALLTHFDASRVDDVRTLRRLLGPEILQQILAVDPHGPGPLPPQRAADLAIVPELPKSACLSAAQQAEAASVGRWLDDYIAWAGAAANETPLSFHTGAGLYLVAVAVGRRLYVQTPWRQQVFPNLYLMLVAVSTYYRKSAGLSLAAELARMSIPHMLLPQPGSPENFLAMLGGVLPPNFSEIPPQDRARLEKGNTFAAQRGLMRDELSGLFKSMGRDFMAGLKELIMTLYDCPPYLDNNTNNKGLVVIRDAALSILGAATPAELSTALAPGDWYNGNLARFALLTPELDYQERPAAAESLAPVELALRLQRLHERLPAPPQPDAFGERRSPEVWSLTAPIWPFCLAYEQALRAMTAPDTPLEDRLRAIYGRLHVQAIKIAILLAALDWCCPHERWDNSVGCKRGRAVVLFASLSRTLPTDPHFAKRKPLPQPADLTAARLATAQCAHPSPHQPRQATPAASLGPPLSPRLSALLSARQHARGHSPRHALVTMQKLPRSP